MLVNGWAAPHVMKGLLFQRATQAGCAMDKEACELLIERHLLVTHLEMMYPPVWMLAPI